jgi:hypothetical protein
VTGQIKIKFKFDDENNLKIIFFYARYLVYFILNYFSTKSNSYIFYFMLQSFPSYQKITTSKLFVKIYLKPDQDKQTKRKIQSLTNGLNPIFNQTVSFCQIIKFK